jgi:hypothetical protein
MYPDKKSTPAIETRNTWSSLQHLDHQHVEQWGNLTMKLISRKRKLCAILAFVKQLGEQESDEPRNKIIEEFGRPIYDYVAQFFTVHVSTAPMNLPRVIYDYKQGDIQQLYCRSQMRQVEAYCQLRDLAIMERDDRLRTGRAYDPKTVKPLSWANIV